MKSKKKELENIERKYNDAVTKLRELETRDIENKRNAELMKSDLTSKDKELEFL